MTKSFKKVIRRLKASHSLKMMHIELYVFKHCYFGHRYTCIWSWVAREYIWPLSWHMLTHGDNSWVNKWYNWILGLQTDDCSQSKKTLHLKKKYPQKIRKLRGKQGIYINILPGSLNYAVEFTFLCFDFSSLKSGRKRETRVQQSIFYQTYLLMKLHKMK